MRDIPVNAKVMCADGPCGNTVGVVINPITRKLTYVVVEDHGKPEPTQRLVPIDQIEATSSELIRLRCTTAELTEMEPFVETHFIENEVPIADYSTAYNQYIMPYATPLELAYTRVDEERVPPGELAIHRWSMVEATDGYVGRVDQFVVDPESEEITHFVLEHGNLFGKKEITLPLSAVDRFEDETVYLKLSKKAIERLPSLPVLRSSIERLELIARVFPDLEGASRALDFLQDMQRWGKDAVKIRNAAVLVKDDQGNTSIREMAEEKDSRRGRVLGALAGGLAGLAVGPVGAVVGAVAGYGAGKAVTDRIDAGLSDEFLTGLKEYMQPNTSAIIVLVEHEWASTLAEAWADMDGVVIQERLTDRLVQDLLADAQQQSQAAAPSEETGN